MNIKLCLNKTLFKKSIYVLSSFLLYILLTLIFEISGYYLNLSLSVLNICSYCIMTLCLMISAFLCARISEKRGWLNAVISAVFFLLLILLTGIIANGTNCDVTGFLLKAPLFIVIAAICGGFGINMKKNN